MSDDKRFAVLYARVSDEDKQDPEQMLRSLDEYAGTRGWPVVAQERDMVTGDPGRRKGDPPGLRRAIERVAALGGKGVLVVTSADRLVRSTVELLQLVARIQALPGFVASMEDGNDCDTTSDFGELTLFMRGWFGRMYLKFVRKQTNRVLKDRKNLIAKHGGFVSSKSGIWRERLGRPGVPQEIVDKVKACWRMRERPALVARLLKIPDSTVRMLYKRCDRESQERSDECPQGKAQKTDGLEGGK